MATELAMLSGRLIEHTCILDLYMCPYRTLRFHDIRVTSVILITITTITLKQEKLLYYFHFNEF